MSAINPFSSNQPGPISPAASLVAITPNDSADLTTVVRSIYVGVGGDVCVVDTAGNTVTHVGAAQGGYLGPFAVSRVNAHE